MEQDRALGMIIGGSRNRTRFPGEFRSQIQPARQARPKTPLEETIDNPSPAVPQSEASRRTGERLTAYRKAAEEQG